MKIILGSSSKNRKGVLENAGYTFEVMVPDIDEKAIRTDDFYSLPLLIANAKADALIERVTEPAILIAADQVVVTNGILQEKPRDEVEVHTYFERYKTYPAETVSALVVINTETGKRASGVERAKIYFKPIPEDVLEQFIATGEAMSNAGGFAMESEILKPYFDRLDGTVDSLRGMPLGLLEKLMKEVA